MKELTGRVLLIRLGALGDTIHATGVAGLIRRRHPRLKIDFLASAGLEPLFTMIPEVDRAFELSLRNLPLQIHPGWWLLSRRRTAAAVRFSTTRTLERLRPSRTLVLRRLVQGLRLLTVALLILGMARPQTGRRQTQRSRHHDR